MTPTEVHAMSLDQYRTFIRYQNHLIKQQQRAAEKRR